MAQFRERVVANNQTVLDQFDFFQVDQFTRILGLAPGDFVLEIWRDNVKQPWPLVAGQATSDGQVGSGMVYFHEIPGQAGHYNVRFRPNATGYWRVVLSYSVVPQVLIVGYQVFAVEAGQAGLTASFIKPSC